MTGGVPDYRFTLANERTFLAWLRTSLALDAGALAVVSIVPEFGPPGTRRVLAVVLAVLGVTVAVAAVLRWRRVLIAMERDEPLPRTRLPVLLASALGLIALAVALLVVTGG